ncbi:MAG TPA: substrate-binding domain-containing protein [Sedimentisphaerales bacterium]|nr:substrate-binding domain-containing protein [Sedimentisphaerales bacterium]
MENRSRCRCTHEMLLLVFLLGAFGPLVLDGCARKQPNDDKGELVVLCGSSFVPPVEQLCSEFKAQAGVEMVTTVGGSEDLLPHVKARMKGDIFITHDPYLDYTRDANALADHVEVGFVAPVLVVQKGNPQGIKSIEDLARPGLKVALTDPQYSTCGEMVFDLLDKKNIKDAVMKNVENRLTKGHSNIGTFLKTQAIDAGIMWNGVAHTFKDSVDIVKTPYEYDEETRVYIMALSYSKEPELLKQFVEFARKRGPEVFAEHGYVK